MINFYVVLQIVGSIGVTLLLYTLFYRLYQKKPIILLHPNIITTALLIFFIAIFQIPYEWYDAGGQVISSFLGICIVVLAVPLYETLETLLKNMRLMLLISLFSVYLSFASIFTLSKLMSIPKDLVISLIPKSITTAMAIEATTITGGIIPITVMAVIITGVLGALIGRTLLKLIKVKEPIAIGGALGMSSHVMGTTQAMEEGPIAGSFSAISIPITGVLTIINLPLFLLIIDHLY